MERLEKRRLNFSCTRRNLVGLTESFEGINIHECYLQKLTKDEFCSGMNALSRTFRTLYTEIINNPQNFAMKDEDDHIGLAKNMNFLLLLAQKGNPNNSSLEINGKRLALALKEAKVTKPDIYFQIFEPLGFITIGLGKKIEASETITLKYPDNHYLLAALKAMADAIGMFSTSKPHHQCNNFFELLDSRVLENYPATKPETTMEYILTKLRGESRDVAKMFYEFINPLSKCEIKGSIGWYWTPTFTLKTTKKVIMSLKLNLESHDVKLNLFNIGKYTELLNNFPAKIINEIKCGGSETESKYAFVFDLDGKTYRKSPETSFVFAKPDTHDSTLLLKLLKKEIEFV